METTKLIFRRKLLNENCKIKISLIYPTYLISIYFGCNKYILYYCLQFTYLRTLFYLGSLRGLGCYFLILNRNINFIRVM